MLISSGNTLIETGRLMFDRKTGQPFLVPFCTSVVPMLCTKCAPASVVQSRKLLSGKDDAEDITSWHTPGRSVGNM